MLKVLSDKAKIILIVAFLVGAIVILVDKARAAEFTGINWDTLKTDNGEVLLQDSTNNCYLVISGGGYSFFKVSLKNEGQKPQGGYGITVRRWDSETGTSWGAEHGLKWALLVSECNGQDISGNATYISTSMENELKKGMGR